MYGEYDMKQVMHVNTWNYRAWSDIGEVGVSGSQSALLGVT